MGAPFFLGRGDGQLCHRRIQGVAKVYYTPKKVERENTLAKGDDR